MILNDWSFTFRKIPNRHDFYFDIVAKDYRVLETDEVIEVETLPKSIMEDEEINYYFQKRSRKSVEMMLKDNMRVKTTPGKGSIMKNSYSTASNYGASKMTPVYRKNIFTPGKSVAARRSVAKTSFLSPVVPKRPFFRYAGVKKPHSKPARVKFDHEEMIGYLELMDVEKFLAQVPRSVVRIMPHFRLLSDTRLRPIGWKKDIQEGGSGPHTAVYSSARGSNKASRTKDYHDFTFKKGDAGEEFSVGGSDHENEAPTLPAMEPKSGKSSVQKQIGFDVVQQGIDNKVLRWDQVEFPEKVVTHLERMIHLLDDEDEKK